MKLPSFTTKRTIRTVIDLETPSDGLTLPLSILRQIVEQTAEFTDTAGATFNIQHGYIGLHQPEHPKFHSLVVEESR